MPLAAQLQEERRLMCHWRRNYQSGAAFGGVFTPPAVSRLLLKSLLITPFWLVKCARPWLCETERQSQGRFFGLNPGWMKQSLTARADF